MTLTGDKFKKFMEQVQLGRDILCGSDFEKVVKFYKLNHYNVYSDNSNDNLKGTEENIRMVAAESLDREISSLKEGENLSRKSYGHNDFYVTIKCSAKEKSINLQWKRWRHDTPLFDQTFEIVI